DIVYQSDRLDIYYRCCRDLITIGAAYVCTCDPGRFRELRLARKPCPCRENPAEENLSLWQKMLDGEFVEGEVTVRIKTDISHPDPAMRDFSLFRIVNSPIHPRTDATVYPLMNFSVTVDDHLLGITHVIRGKDHIANTLRQRYLFDYFGWVRPHYIHYGRMSISGVVLSTSGMREGIASGTYSGWDDIRLGTLRALARRGIRPEAVRNAMLDISIGETDISFSWENLYAHNKAIVDPEANRYFFVPDPVEFMIRDAPIHEAKALLHPNDPSRGYRALTCRGSIVIPRDELAGNAKRSMLRLKDLFNVRIEETDGHPVLVYAGDSLEEARKAKAPIIQWLPAEEKLPCVLHGQEGDCTGFCEPRVAEEIGNVVQFERIGFARIDLHTACGIEALFLHR
ncbi:MAG: glutamate--tRNA ligase, partial [Methanomicrobiaceae archaeon]|nr:glutamate--tRNA ligase [Methanomicrobiaceae archaeon]